MKTREYIRSMPKINNFLQKGVSHTRQSILDIDDSYNNEWDILAELLQNSVDAIRERGIKDGKISIKVDCQNKSIGVNDNGIGIEPEEILDLLALFGTNKKGKEDSIGEKGVGLKFALFSCNDFMLKTATKSGATEVKIVDAYNWKKSNSNEDLPLNIETINRDFEGTEILLTHVQESPIFDLTLPQLRYILRTRTAIGNTRSILKGSDINIEVELNYTSPEGSFQIEQVPFKYLLPIEDLSKSEILDLNDYYTYTKEGDRDNSQKRTKLRDKIVYTTRAIPAVNRNRFVYAFVCLVPGRATWAILNNKFSLATEEDLKDENFLQNFSYAIIQSGIFTSVKGMPTGIKVEIPYTGTAGAWGSIFMLFEDTHLSFDIGRKSIHGKTQKVYQKYARDLFNELKNNVLKYISGDIDENIQWDRDQIFEEIDGLIDLDNPFTKFIKSPKDQEAAVASIFYELIGSGKITKLEPLTAGYKNKYDLYAKWEGKRVVIEFKTKLNKLIKDGSDQTKLFNEIDCAVCWDVSEEDTQSFKDVNVTLSPLEKSLLGKHGEDFPHATHVLRYSVFAKPIYVIDLKLFLTSLIKNG